MKQITAQEYGDEQESKKKNDSLYSKGDYKYGFTTPIETEELEKGLNENTIRAISKKKDEPEFILEFRLKAYRHWQSMKEPKWAHLDHEKIDFNEISYFSSPKNWKNGPKSIDEVDKEVLDTFNRLGIPLEEQKRISGVAVDAVFDSVSVGTTHQEQLKEDGVIFCSISEAIAEYPELVKKYLGSVVPYTDNYYASLNSAVFTDGSFVYIPKGVKCPIELSTYFRINSAQTGQFERTLIIAEEESSVSYLEGCTAPMRDENQLHAAVVELIALDKAKIKYSTVQNWYSGDKAGKGGIYNFVTKRGIANNDAHISWIQVEAGSAITWKYPSVILKGDRSRGEFYSVALTNGKMQADTGTKMTHLGKDTTSKIISKGICADQSTNSYRGRVFISPKATNARNFTQCDSMLVGDQCKANTYPYIEVKNQNSTVEHEATTSKMNEEQLFYIQSRGIDQEEAIGLVLNGFCKDVFKKLPLEFAVEAFKLLEIKLEGSVG